MPGDLCLFKFSVAMLTSKGRDQSDCESSHQERSRCVFECSGAGTYFP
jgi:hypothetical protein